MIKATFFPFCLQKCRAGCLPLARYLGERTVIKDFHPTDDQVVLYPLSHLLIETREQAGLRHDGHRQPQAKEEAGALQPLGGPAHHQGATWGVRQGEEILAGRWERWRALNVLRYPSNLNMCSFFDLVRQCSLSPGMSRYRGRSPVAMTRVSAVTRFFHPFVSVT